MGLPVGLAAFAMGEGDFLMSNLGVFRRRPQIFRRGALFFTRQP